MRLAHGIGAVLFDMDGLLIDSERVVRDAMVAVAHDRGQGLPLDVFMRMVGLPESESRAVAVGHFGADFDIDGFDTAVETMIEEELIDAIVLKSGVVEMLEFLEARAIPRAVVTSSSHATVERHLGRLGVLGRFQTIVAAGDYPRGKPNPDPYLEAARRLATPPQACLALEDSHNGVRAARAAGMATVMVPDLLEATEEMRGLCIAIADDLHQVRRMMPLVWSPRRRR